MSAYYSDTDPGIEQLQIELIRNMPSWKKFALIDDINETVRAHATSGIRQRHPDASPAQVQRRLADLLLGPELALKIYGLHQDS